jgi:hypothetical protein
MTTDEEAAAFLASDLSDLDFSQFKPRRFEFRRAGPSAIRLSPGTPAPRSGTYQQIGPRGGRLTKRVTSSAGQPLPPAPPGRSWRFVEASNPKRRHS